MIQITAQTRILVAVEPADFRKGIDGLARLCQQALHDDPFSGTLFVFRNRNGKSIKILGYDGQGFWLCQKRLSQGRFRFWPKANEPTTSLLAYELQVLLNAGDPQATQAPAPWRQIQPRI